MMKIKNVTVFGSGVLGAQIAFQTAYRGYQVTLFDIKDELLEQAKLKFAQFKEFYQQDLNAPPADLDDALTRIYFTTDLAESVKDADLTIEAIPENIQIKKEFYTRLGAVAPAKTIFCTNSSTLLPSQFAVETGRPGQFLALHFANYLWKNNVAEIMGHAGTDQEIFDQVVQFAKSIGMLAIPIYKEQPGYVMNSLLVPWLMAGLDLFRNGIADAASIDKTWMKTLGATLGPMAMSDLVGMNTAYNVIKSYAESTGDEVWKQRQDFMKENFIDKNKLGISSGEGFYKYPNPAYQDADFLK
ncbi:3-hydroxyacyl-CoA dehydrogenase [Mucilaginibacter sp. KACC 22063]|uniref:3-hydroxyacyl-CoA dehydrogenase n=1 Tax=Mucilaginibacter sp. KACC 22063 TaxID=3025666 RepID=UPI002365070C|nr:3-hydroxyacyl-CoA dehydrogenase [Mucilaginibacter sp. KACC 22063]WDF55864.1 3-hydroxyacyl-CoA dehydrogenase [Mucilaginibacter sp. KACC 22063]